MYAPVTTVIRHLFIFHFSACSMDKVRQANPQRHCLLASNRAWSSQCAHRTYAQRASHFEHLAGLQSAWLCASRRVGLLALA